MCPCYLWTGVAGAVPQMPINHLLQRMPCMQLANSQVARGDGVGVVLLRHAVRAPAQAAQKQLQRPACRQRQDVIDVQGKRAELLVPCASSAVHKLHAA